MRKIIILTSVSLDGYFEGPARELDWQLVDEELHEHLNEVLGPMGAFLAGRVSHELMAAYWPTAELDPAATPAMRAFATIWRDMPKYVYSRTLDGVGWNSTLVREVVPDEIRKLQQEPGGDMVVGGGEVARAFLAYDLIDEFRIYVHPVLIGRGNQPFRPSDLRFALRTVETKTFGNGVMLLRYQRSRPVDGSAAGH